MRSDPGCVEVWPVFSRAKTHQTESWLDPVDHAGQLDPALQLAERICDEIAAHQGRPLPGSDEPLNYGDILVLVRKRDRFITALTRTMKDRGLQVAGADRFTPLQIISRLKICLRSVSLSLIPQDDLTLACVLKGPLFDLGEEVLFDFAMTEAMLLFRPVAVRFK